MTKRRCIILAEIGLYQMLANYRPSAAYSVAFLLSFFVIFFLRLVMLLSCPVQIIKWNVHESCRLIYQKRLKASLTLQAILIYRHRIPTTTWFKRFLTSGKRELTHKTKVNYLFRYVNIVMTTTTMMLAAVVSIHLGGLLWGVQWLD